MDSLHKVVHASGPETIVSATNQLVQSLQGEIRQRYNFIKLNILAEEGIDGLFKRFNGKSVGQILDEFKVENDEPIAEGTIEGIRYKLY